MKYIPYILLCAVIALLIFAFIPTHSHVAVSPKPYVEPDTLVNINASPKWDTLYLEIKGYSPVVKVCLLDSGKKEVASKWVHLSFPASRYEKNAVAEAAK